MSRKIQIGAALVLVVAVAAMAPVGRQSRRDRDTYRRTDTRAVKQRNISDTARNAISALHDAEAGQQDQSLPGETAYSEANADRVRVWQNESGTLELVAAHDTAAPGRIRNGSTIVYPGSQRRLAAGAAALFRLPLSGIFLMILAMRQVCRIARDPEPRGDRFVASTN